MAAMLFGTVNTARASSSFSLDDNLLNINDEGLYRPDFFYFVYMAASGYVSMVLLGWDMAVVDDETQEFSIDTGMGSTWAKMSASWLCAALYLWSLVAHQLLQRWREF